MQEYRVVEFDICPRYTLYILSGMQINRRKKKNKNIKKMPRSLVAVSSRYTGGGGWVGAGRLPVFVDVVVAYNNNITDGGKNKKLN